MLTEGNRENRSVERAVIAIVAALVAAGCVVTDDQPEVGVDDFAVGSCWSVSSEPTAPGPSTIGSTVTLNHQTLGCSNPEFRLWVYPAGGPWRLAQDWSTSTSTAWNTTGFAPGHSYLQIWVRDQGAAVEYEAWDARYYELVEGVPAAECLTIGFTTTTVTGVSECSDEPEYQFWLYPPGGPWEQLQDWSTSGEAPTDGVPDASMIQVWTREVGSSELYEAWGTVNYYTSPVCSSVSARLDGDPLQFTIDATCHGIPEYIIYMLPPGGPWTLLTDWTPDRELEWDTTGLAEGNYGFQVWVRAQGASTAYDAWTGLSHAIGSCTDASLVASASPVTVGATVTLTSSSASCGSPSYTLYMLPPDGDWVQLQASSPQAEYWWDTTGAVAGTYYFQSWVVQTGSQSFYDDVGYLSVDLL